jgi:co-chaperonin GroES (HSP10)
MRPARGLLLVRPVETDDIQRGIVLLSDTRERMTQAQCEVVAVGEPAICEDADCDRPHEMWPEFDVHKCVVRVGAWLLVRPRSFIEGPTPECKEWFVHQDDVLAILTED